MSDVSLLDMIEEVTDELELPRITTIIGSVDPQARRFLRLANRQGRALMREFDWIELQRLHTFSTVLNQSEYDFPDDYDRITIDTVWDRGMLTPIVGPIFPATWQAIKSGLIGSGIYFRRYRLLRSATTTTAKFTIDPPSPNAGDTLAFEYISNGWCQNPAKTEVFDEFSSDNDTLLLNRDLMVMGVIWRWQKAQFLDFSASLAEYNEELDRITGRNTPSPAVSLAGADLRQHFLGYVNIPDSGYGR